MLGALGILGYAASMMTHEALGHGGFCLAAGGHNVMLTAWMERCHFPGVHGPGIKVAGPGVQFGAGLLAWGALHCVRPGAMRLRYFLWLSMVFDLLVSSGYVAFSGVTNIGDAAEVVAGFQPHGVWRSLLVLVGSLIYFLSMLAGAFELKRMAGPDGGRGRLYRLVWVPYASVGVFACVTCTLNHTVGREAGIGMAVASSLGAGLGLFGLPELQRGMAVSGSGATRYVTWSGVWGMASALAIVAFLFFLGPGLP